MLDSHDRGFVALHAARIRGLGALDETVQLLVLLWRLLLGQVPIADVERDVAATMVWCGEKGTGVVWWASSGSLS